jgi:hypothetical protein
MRERERESRGLYIGKYILIEYIIASGELLFIEAAANSLLATAL